MQEIKDIFKGLELSLLTIIVILGYSFEQISVDWCFIIVGGYVLINVIRVATEPFWKTAKRISKEISKLKISLLKENKKK